MTANPNAELNTRAHFRPPVSIATPCFARHVGIFFPDRRKREATASRPIDPFDREVIKTELRTYVLRLLSRARSASRLPTAEKLLDEAFAKNRTAVVNLGTYLDLSVRLKADLYSEHCTVTILLDNFADGFVRTKHPDLEEVLSALRANLAVGDPHFSKSAPGDHLVHSAIWTAFDRDFGGPLSSDVQGTVFADFRGVIVCATDDLVRPPTDKKATRWGRAFAAMPTVMRLSERPKDVHKFFQDNLNFFFPCLGLTESGELATRTQPDVRWELNNILCEMVDGAAIYGSSLGNPLTSEDDAEPIPIRYFVIYNGLSTHEIGRLIRRLHTVAELRIAALFDRSSVMGATQDVRKIGGELTQLIADATASRFKNIDIHELEQIIYDYNQLGQACNGGLAYRVNRCLYYQEALDRRLPDLRERAIDGWQSYTRFVNRNFAQTYCAIQSIGDRYKQIGVRIDRGLAIYDAQRAAKIMLYSLIIAWFVGVVTTYSVGITAPAFNQYPHSYLVIAALLLPSLVVGAYILLSRRFSKLREKFSNMQNMT